MVDPLTPLPPISSRITKTQVTEKDPHHHEKKEQEHEQEEVEDEVIIENPDNISDLPAEENKKIQPAPPNHKIDIEV